jgi:hypothetical protein
VFAVNIRFRNNNPPVKTTAQKKGKRPQRVYIATLTNPTASFKADERVTR